MFNYIKIEGFRGFKQVELDLSPLSVLIGPNGAGKSNLLDLLMLMSEAGNGQLANGVYKRGGFRTSPLASTLRRKLASRCASQRVCVRFGCLTHPRRRKATRGS